MIRPTHQAPRPTPEQLRFFDALCFWRTMYGRRGPQDSVGLSGIHSVIADVERRMWIDAQVESQVLRRFGGATQG